jgi:GMP synthase-like glutamine amidotransferase
MRLHVIQHVPFEGPALIGDWAQERGHEVTTRLALAEEFPAPDSVDLLAVMGGPMGADEDAAYPWLRAEKRFVAEAIAAGCRVLGVCLGAQIVAEVIGGRVRRNDRREIGWYPVWPTEAGRAESLLSDWDGPRIVGHWHGDTFDLPAGLEALLSSEVTPNQGFVFDERVVGLQCHLEWTRDALAELADACAEELGDPNLPWSTTGERLLGEAPVHMPGCKQLLFGLLDRLAAR